MNTFWSGESKRAGLRMNEKKNMYSSGNDPGTTNESIQMICFPIATDCIPPLIVPLKRKIVMVWIMDWIGELP